MLHTFFLSPQELTPDQKRMVAENRRDALLRKRARDAAAKTAEASHALSLLRGPLEKKQKELQPLRFVVEQSLEEVHRGRRMVRVREDTAEGPVLGGATVAWWRRATIASYDQQQRFVNRLRSELDHLQKLTYTDIQDTSLRAALLAANAENVRLKECVFAKEAQRLLSSKPKADLKRSQEQEAMQSVQEAKQFLVDAEEKHSRDVQNFDAVASECQALGTHVATLQDALDVAREQEEAVKHARGVSGAPTSAKPEEAGEEDDAKEGGDEPEDAGKEDDEIEANDEQEEESDKEEQEAGEHEHAQQDQADEEDETGAELEDERHAKRHRAC